MGPSAKGSSRVADDSSEFATNVNAGFGPISPITPLDTGIRTEFNRCSGNPGEVAEGEVNAHLGNPGST